MPTPRPCSARAQTPDLQAAGPHHPEGALVTKDIANNSAKRLAKEEDWSTRQWNAMRFQWAESILARVRTCRHWSIRADRSVDVVPHGQSAGLTGLATCGSVHACPMCNPAIQSMRALEIGIAITLGMLRGSVLFGTFTIPHPKKGSLATTWGLLMLLWARFVITYKVRKARATLGYYGTIRVTEVTFDSESGHPHIHYLLFFDRELSSEEIEALHALQCRAWSDLAMGLHIRRPSHKYQSLRVVTEADASEMLSQYLTKSRWGSNDPREGVGGSGRSPWQLLADVMATGLVEDLNLWHEYERASKGRRTCDWSRGLRATLGFPPRHSSGKSGSAGSQGSDTVGRPTSQGSPDGVPTGEGFAITDWKPVTRDPRLGAQLLASINATMDFQAGLRFCEAHGIPTTSLRPQPGGVE